MSIPILATKLYIPPPRSKVVLRPRLIERLNENLPSGRKLTLISAPAGFGKTTLVGEWIAGCGQPAAWLSLDEGDNDLTRFLIYFVAALQTIAANIGKGVLGRLQSPQPPSAESILTALLNEIVAIPDQFILVLDDYHMVDSKPVDKALAFLLEHLPPQMHLVIATREDPQLPLARLRAQGQLTELRAADLRFTPAEAVDFLNRVMGLNLLAEEIAALETRTEGWIVGLQLAAISMQGHKDAAGFINSFTGSHHFVMDYLVEEVLQHQSSSVHTFLLRTSILDRLCGPLCDAVMLDSTASGQETLEYLEQANLFIAPLDNERRWYRFHHLFSDLLRQRLHQSADSSLGDDGKGVAEFHIRASQWYETNGLAMEAFPHAVAAHDIDRAVRLIEGKGMPVHFRGVVTPIINWLASLPKAVIDARPSLWARHAEMLLINGQTTGVEEKLQAAETALQGADLDDKTRNLIGRIAGARATLALTRYQAETMLAQSRRALEYLHSDSLSSRAAANWTLGFAHLLHGDRVAARRALTEGISLSQAAGDIFTAILATIGLGMVQEAENQLYPAAETYRRVLQLVGDHPQQIINEVHLGLARIFYEWNDLDAAERHGLQSVQLARQYEKIIDRFIICEVFLARLKLARGDGPGAAAILDQADQSARRQNFVHRIPEVAAAQVLTFLRLGNLTAAAHLAEEHKLPLIQARVYLARGETSAALMVLDAFRRQMEAKGWEDERLKAMVLQVVAHHEHGEKDKAVQLLGEALALAKPGGFIRIFVDEGPPMARLLSVAAARGMMPDYTSKLLAACEAEKLHTNSCLGQTSQKLLEEGSWKQKNKDTSPPPPASFAQSLLDPLSPRELEVLQLIAQGLSNREISKRLFLELSTVKGHNQKIFAKLDVQRRTEAVARARELGLL